MAEMPSKCFSQHLYDGSAKFDLMTAASVGDLRMVENLLANLRCDPDAVNQSGWTALLYAAQYGHYNVIKALIARRCNVEFQEKARGRTAMMLAASNGHTRCIEVLIKYGRANIKAVDLEGHNASYYAIHFGHGTNKLIKVLLGIPEDVGTVNKRRSDTKSEHSAPAKIMQNSTPRKWRPSPLSLKTAPSPATGVDSRRLVSPMSPLQPSPLHTSTPTRFITAQLSPTTAVPSPVSPMLPVTMNQLLHKIDLSMYIPLFQENCIDLYTFLTLSDDDFLIMGVTAYGHRKKMSIAQMRYRESVVVRGVQESFLADWLLQEREKLSNKVRDLEFRVKLLEEELKSEARPVD